MFLGLKLFLDFWGYFFFLFLNIIKKIEEKNEKKVSVYVEAWRISVDIFYVILVFC